MSGDPRSRVAIVIGLMRQLAELMRAEEALVKEMRLERLEVLGLEKAALAGSYERELRRLRVEPETMAALGAEERALFEEAMRAFQAAARRNAERLRQGRVVVEGVARVMAESAGEAAPAPSYGLTPRPTGETSGRVIAVAFDRRC